MKGVSNFSKPIKNYTAPILFKENNFVQCFRWGKA